MCEIGLRSCPVHKQRVNKNIQADVAYTKQNYKKQGSKHKYFKLKNFTATYVEYKYNMDGLYQ